MHLRASISKTKKFFKKTIYSIKSFLSGGGGYQKLPKSPPFQPFSCSDNLDMKFSQNYRELDKFYTDFTTHWDRDVKEIKPQKNKKKLLTSTETEDQEKKGFVYGGGKGKEGSSCFDDDQRETRGACLVEKKLKELELMDKGNVEHMLDIEEVLHYYSRLTCPAYLDIVDKFFMDMYTDLFNLQSSARCDNSMLRLRSLKL